VERQPDDLGHRHTIGCTLHYDTDGTPRSAWALIERRADRPAQRT
jgi:hypothetical protein